MFIRITQGRILNFRDAQDIYILSMMKRINDSSLKSIIQIWILRGL